VITVSFGRIPLVGRRRGKEEGGRKGIEVPCPLRSLDSRGGGGLNDSADLGTFPERKGKVRPPK